MIHLEVDVVDLEDVVDDQIVGLVDRPNRPIGGRPPITSWR